MSSVSGNQDIQSMLIQLLQQELQQQPSSGGNDSQFEQMIERYLQKLESQEGEGQGEGQQEGGHSGGYTPTQASATPAQTPATPAATTTPAQTTPAQTTPAQTTPTQTKEATNTQSTNTQSTGDKSQPNAADKTINISGSDKTITMSNTSDKPMTLYHTGGDGGATKAVATLQPGETVNLTVGDNSSGAFTKGDANGNFTSNSGRVEYSVEGGKMSANLDSECGVNAMSLNAGPYSKSVTDPTADAPANLKDSSGRLLEPKSNPDVQAYLDSIPGYSNNSYTHWNSDTQTNVMQAAMLDVNSISASFG